MYHVCQLKEYKTTGWFADQGLVVNAIPVEQLYFFSNPSRVPDTRGEGWAKCGLLDIPTPIHRPHPPGQAEGLYSESWNL